MTPNTLIPETLRQLNSAFQCLNTGETTSIKTSGMICHGDKHSVGILFSCGCCDGRIFDFHHERPHTTTHDQIACDCNVLAMLQINFDCRLIGEYELDGPRIEDLIMTAEIASIQQRQRLAESRAHTVIALEHADNTISRADIPNDGKTHQNADPEHEALNVETKERILSLTLNGCAICGCHKGDDPERLLASAGILNAGLLANPGHQKCDCDCPCCLED